MSRHFKQRRSRRLDLEIMRDQALHEMENETNEAMSILAKQIDTLEQEGLNQVISLAFPTVQEVGEK